MADLPIGPQFAGWHVEAVIGRGGMGVVYRGRDPRLDRPVAIKLIAAEHAADAGARRRFEREARLMAAIDHPNVIPVYAAGEEDGHLYLVMRYVAGTDLHHLLAERGRLDPGEAARIVGQVAAALDAAHARGLVHRDIKPANVLLGSDHVYLTDFGITRAVDANTRLTESHERVGTLDFMSPEQLRGEPTTLRSDVYSLGCLLHTCLTGTPPFHRSAATATILAHISDRPPRPSATPRVPSAFDPVVRRALAKDPRDRYPTAGELGAAAVAAVQAPEPRRRLRVRRASVAAEAAPTAVLPAGEEVESGPGTDRTQVHPELHPTGPLAPVPQDGRRRRRWRLLASAVLLLAAIAVVLVTVVLPPSAAPGPLTRSDVTQTVDAFSTAYGHRSLPGLARVLAPGAVRVSATGEQHGRGEVLAEYARQFAANAIRGYVVEGLAVVPGWAARAAGIFRVTLVGGGAFGGRVVFGLERVAGRPVIELITTEAGS